LLKQRCLRDKINRLLDGTAFNFTAVKKEDIPAQMCGHRRHADANLYAVTRLGQSSGLAIPATGSRPLEAATWRKNGTWCFVCRCPNPRFSLVASKGLVNHRVRPAILLAIGMHCSCSVLLANGNGKYGLQREEGGCHIAEVESGRGESLRCERRWRWKWRRKCDREWVHSLLMLRTPESAASFTTLNSEFECS
jgi:hypothetical protein